MQYNELHIRLETRDDGAYDVVAAGEAGEAAGVLALPFSDLELENFVLRVGRTRRGTRRLESPEMQRARDFGGRLFDSLFSSKVRDLYRDCSASARADGRGLRLKLSLGRAPELADIPWEYLYDSPSFLSISQFTPVVRYLELPRARSPLAVELPLRVLAMISAPIGAVALDVEAERRKVEQALGERLLDRDLVEITWLEQATLRGLQRELRRGPYHVFHFIGHGAYDPALEESVLLLEDETGHGRPVSGAQLGTMLADHTSLRLAVLNACEGARTSRDDPFSGVAAALVQHELPAVIAMQFEITDRAAIIFAEELYAALVEGLPVDAALAETRKAIYGDGNDIEWGTPVLFMRVRDGQLFALPTLPADVLRTTERHELERAALEQATFEEAVRLPHEQAEAERLAKQRAEQAEREEAERLAKQQAEQAEREEAERLAKQQAERDEAERVAKEQEERQEAEREVRERAERGEARGLAVVARSASVVPLLVTALACLGAAAFALGYVVDAGEPKVAYKGLPNSAFYGLPGGSQLDWAIRSLDPLYEAPLWFVWSPIEAFGVALFVAAVVLVQRAVLNGRRLRSDAIQPAWEAVIGVLIGIGLVSLAGSLALFTMYDFGTALLLTVFGALIILSVGVAGVATSRLGGSDVSLRWESLVGGVGALLLFVSLFLDIAAPTSSADSDLEFAHGSLSDMGYAYWLELAVVAALGLVAAALAHRLPRARLLAGGLLVACGIQAALHLSGLLFQLWRLDAGSYDEHAWRFGGVVGVLGCALLLAAGIGVLRAGRLSTAQTSQATASTRPSR